MIQGNSFDGMFGGWSGFGSNQEHTSFYFPPLPERDCDPLNFFFGGYRGYSPSVKGGYDF
jgi:hypothetical protein